MTFQAPIVLDESDMSDAGPQTVTILLVDDQIMVGEAVRRSVCNEPGVEFHFCANPLEAIDTAKRIRPTVILQDLVMPAMNGLDLVREYRADPATKAIPIIVMSTKEEATVKSEAFRIGANDYLVKLPDRIELIARIRYHSEAYLSLIQRDEAYRALRKSQQELMEINLELQRLTNVDGLTGLSNRRYFEEYFETEWRNAIRSKDPISLLMIDIDHFKQYNDTYGHLGGDEVLRAVAQAVKGTFMRPKDLAVRMGGEEFVVILPHTPATSIAILGNKVVRAVENLGIPHSGSSVSDKVTISVGGATCVPGLDDLASSLVEKADQAMYQAKHSGRNRAVVHCD